MKKLNLILAKLGFFIFFVFNPFVQADELISKNISVIDGDTIVIENKKIRFSGIDAPESFFRGKKQTCLLNSIKIFCGEVSKEKLEKKIANKIVKCIPEKEWSQFGAPLQTGTWSPFRIASNSRRLYSSQALRAFSFFGPMALVSRYSTRSISFRMAFSRSPSLISMLSPLQ